MRALLFWVAVTVLGGCAGANWTQLRERATFDLVASATAAGQPCAESQISLRQVNNLTFAFGCAREARYVEDCRGGCHWQLSDTVWPEGSHDSAGRLKPGAFGGRKPAGTPGDQTPPTTDPPPAG